MVSAPSSPPLSADPAQFPRVYQSSLGYRVSFGFAGLLLSAAAIVGIWYFGTGHEILVRQGAIVLVILCIAFFLLGAYLVVAMLKGKLTLTVDAIEITDAFLSKHRLRSEFSGYRILPTQYVSTLLLVPRDPAAKKLKIALTMKPDNAFDAWLSPLTNLDEQDRVESLAALDSNQELGLTQEQRAERFAQAAKIAKAFNIISFAASAWSWFYPRPYELAILVLALIPVAAALLGMRSKGLYQFEGRRNDARPSLATPVILPGMILALRALIDVSFLDWKLLLVPGLAATIALTAAVASADPRISSVRARILPILLLSAAYGMGVAATADAVLDHSRPQVFQTEVLYKYVSTGRHTTRYLRLAPWGPQQKITQVGVARSLYASVQPGQIVCVYFLPGALKIPWYQVASCAPAHLPTSR